MKVKVKVKVEQILTKCSNFLLKFGNKLPPQEKKYVIPFFVFCCFLPFGMAYLAGGGSWFRTFSYLGPVWGNYYSAVSYWRIMQKPIWQAFLASYGVTSAGVIWIYFGTYGIQKIAKKFSEILERGVRISFTDREVTVRKYDVQKFNPPTKSRKEGFFNRLKNRLKNWLEKKSFFFILLVFFLPIPWSNTIATIVMRLRKIEKGLWYLLLLNIAHVFLVVWLIYQGTGHFIFHYLDFFARLLGIG